MRLLKTLLLVGVALSLVAFLPSYVANDGEVSYGRYDIHILQIIDSVHMRVDVRNNQSISLYILTLEDSYRFIDGTPLDDLSKMLALENITEYSGIMFTDNPGLHGFLITTHQPSGWVSYYASFIRPTPHLWLLAAGLTMIGLSFLRYMQMKKV